MTFHISAWIQSKSTLYFGLFIFYLPYIIKFHVIQANVKGPWYKNGGAGLSPLYIAHF